jgi:hypothetical protein
MTPATQVDGYESISQRGDAAASAICWGVEAKELARDPGALRAVWLDASTHQTAQRSLRLGLRSNGAQRRPPEYRLHVVRSHWRVWQAAERRYEKRLVKLRSLLLPCYEREHSRMVSKVGSKVL